MAAEHLIKKHEIDLFCSEVENFKTELHCSKYVNNQSFIVLFLRYFTVDQILSDV